MSGGFGTATDPPTTPQTLLCKPPAPCAALCFLAPSLLQELARCVTACFPAVRCSTSLLGAACGQPFFPHAMPFYLTGFLRLS